MSMSMRLKTLNILKLNDILNNILKLKFESMFGSSFRHAMEAAEITLDFYY